jgi:tetratricopeptide (TPR) repeat protein
MDVAPEGSGVGSKGDPAPGARRPLGGRYRVLNEIGRGGMGRVYRVLDHRTGRVVTLKRVLMPLDLGDKDTREARLSLAAEFRLLASLRHPNIISVLDYGFDEYGEPYYTMDLAENARTIVEAGAPAPLAVQGDLLVQTLRALVYLHRHGIIHRDLKPPNILVVGDQVKLLDFGLALRRGTGEPGEFAGTPLYMAPEILRGEPASAQSDLYALGMVAYEMLLGRRPLDMADHRAYRTILTQVLPLPGDLLGARLRPTLAWLLAKDPAERPGDASQVIAALASAIGLPLAAETAATRESLLQAAPFVGRRRELETLLGSLRGAREGQGSAWLVAGESGVGKSRLVEEVRTAALVDDVVVAIGQVRSQGGGPYHAWQEVLLTLVLGVDVSDAEASVLKAVVPTIDAVLGRPVADAPPLDPEGAQSRLLFAVERLVRRQPQPMLVVIEDLQWAGSETQRLWSWLAHAAVEARLMLVGSVRTDEAPHLLDELSMADLLRIGRLDPDEAVQLAESMMGAAAREGAVVKLLARESEGVPFFLVELIRTLAEQAGGLDAIQGDSLAPGLSSNRMTRLVRRRLDRVPSHAMEALQAAAVAARAVDLRLMQGLFPDLHVDEWAASCSAPAVLELSSEEWRFAHDKLREQILLDLEPAQLRTLHRRVAEALEATYPDHTGYLTALAHHWCDAGDPEKEGWYAQRAGLLALQNGACREAITLLGRALELLERSAPTPMSSSRSVRGRSGPRAFLDRNAGIDPESIEFRLGTIEGALTEAYYRLGDLRGCREHAERALGHLGQRLPRGKLGWVAASAQQGFVRALQSVWKRPPADLERTRRVAGVIGRVYVRLAESYMARLEPLPMLWSTLRFINHCEGAGPSPELALGYLAGALRAEAVPARGVSRAWSARALEIAERTGAPRDVAFVQSRISMIHLGACRWPEAAQAIERATQVSDAAHDLRLSIECRALAGALWEYTGEFERGAAVWKEAHRLSLASGNRQTEFWGLVGQGDNWSRLGRYDEALRLFEAAGEKGDEDAMRSEAVWRFGMLALTRLRAGDLEGAQDAAMRALRHLRATNPVVYYMQSGTAATAEVLLALREAQRERTLVRAPGLDRSAHDACVSLRRFASSFAVGRPPALLWSGVEAWLDGRPSRARRFWERALAEAAARSMPYEEGSAHLEIGRRLPAEDPQRQRHLQAAVAVFERVGCAADAARARAALGATR